MLSAMRWRRGLGVVIAVVACIAVIALNWPRAHDSTAVAAAPTTTTTSTTTTTTTVPKPEHPFEAADAVVSEVQVYDAPGATESSSSLPNPTVEKVPLAF